MCAREPSSCTCAFVSGLVAGWSLHAPTSLPAVGDLTAASCLRHLRTQPCDRPALVFPAVPGAAHPGASRGAAESQR
jgi:hypothetical protein